MRKPINILYLGVALSLLTGCDNNTAIAPPCGEGPVEVSLSASVSIIETTVTRNIITGNTLEERAEIGVFGLTKKDGSFADPYLSNQQYLYAGPNGQLLAQPANTVINYPPGQDKLHLYGYYPYTGQVATDRDGNASIPVKGTTGSEEVTDYLYTGAMTGSKALAAAGGDYRVSLSLKHAMAILRFNIYTDTRAYTPDSHPLLNSLSFTTREGQEGTMDIRSGAITSADTDNTTPATFDYTAESLGIIAGGDPIIKDYLLFPYEHAEHSALRKLTLNVQMPGEAVPKDIVVFDETDTDENRHKVIVKLKAGYITTVNIKYTQDMAARANVNNWMNGEEYTFE